MPYEIIPQHAKFNRPWGWYENLIEGVDYKVKRIEVNSGQQISLQYHQHRSEYWTVVKGSGYVTIDKEAIHAVPGKTFIIPVSVVHRLTAEENGITIIEVQMGEKCIEEDIVRLEDDYSRV